MRVSKGWGNSSCKPFRTKRLQLVTEWLPKFTFSAIVRGRHLPQSAMHTSEASFTDLKHTRKGTVVYPRRSVGIVPQTIAGLSFLLLIVGTTHATFPGRNGLIAFQAQTDTGIQIFTVHPNGQGLQRITHVNGDAVAPDWSPDGRQIVFEHDAPGECANVAIMNADGTGLIEFPDPTLCQLDPSFTPDGTRIIFDRFDPTTNDEAFWSMDRNGNDRQRIGPCCFDPNASPDGEKLSFLSGPTGGKALFTSNIDGSNVFQVTPYSFDVAVKQDWAPDGRHLVFTKDGDVLKPGVSANIATINPDGTHLRFVTHYQGGNISAFVGSYSPDGKWIVFRLNDHGLFGLFKIRPDGTHLKTIIPLSSFRPRFIDWGAQPSEADDEDDDAN
jgi:Tol biopolymer transport system component